MRRNYWLIGLLCALTLSGCDINFSSTTSTITTSTTSSSSNASSLPEGVTPIPETPEFDDNLPKPPMPEYTEFWDVNSVVEFRFDIEPEQLQNISDCGGYKDDWRNTMYFPITVHLFLNDTHYMVDEVGMRLKGNTSRHPFVENGTINDSMPGFKLSFSETWTDDYYESYGLRKSWQNDEPDYEARQARRLFDMEKLDFKFNRPNDRTIISQPFAFRLFRAYSDIATQSSMAALSINNGTETVNMGIYVTNEAIDKTLIRRHFSKPESQGDLYKCLWPTDFLIENVWGKRTIYEEGGNFYPDTTMIGIEDDIAGYHPTYDLKTNRKTSDHHALVNMIKTLNLSTHLSGNDLIAALEAVIDIDSFLKFAAISYLTGNPDDLRHNVNNLYLYFHPVTEKAYFIPYDYDWSLGVAWNDWLGQALANIHPHYFVSFVAKNPDNSQQWQQNPLYWYTICYEEDGYEQYSERYPRVDAYRDAYDDYVMAVASSSEFSFASYESMFDTYKNNYESFENDLVEEDYFSSKDIFLNYRTAIIAQVNTAYGQNYE
jgi:spore coat protein CotH